MKKLSMIFCCLAALLTSCGAKGGATADTQTPQDSTFTRVAHPQWTRDAVIYEVNLRQFTDEGNLKGFEAQLDRLKDLGVDILWFMPVNPISEKNRKGELGSYYAVKDYKGFNPEFGTVEEFKALVKKAHDMGFKVIIDWVANHTGCDNIWIEKHPDWYMHNEKGEMYGPYDWTDTYKLDYSNKEMRAAMIDALTYWVKDIDIDGFRCDVAGEVPTDFWNDARKELEKAKPEIFMLAEASKPELEKDAFDAGYNWPMKDLFSAIAYTSGQYTFKKAGEEPRTFEPKNALAIDSLLNDQAKEYPRDSYLMNMVTNHDLNSWEGTEFERLGNLSQAFAVLSYTLPGMPLIYTGQETGLNRALEFFKKDKAPEWEPRNEYFYFYKTLNDLKHSQPALLAGDQGAPMVRYATENPNVYVFSREKDGKKVVVLVNLGNEASDVRYKESAPVLGDKEVNAFSGKREPLPNRLAPGEYKVYATK